MNNTDAPGVYTIRIRRTITAVAHIRITAPHAEAAMVAAQDNDDLPARFKPVRVRLQYDDVTKNRRNQWKDDS